MKVTESRYKNRQLHIEDYLQMVSAEQKEYAEVFDYSKIAEKSGVITDYWTSINVNIKMYIFDHLRMYIFAILPLDRYIFLSDKIFL